VPPRQALLALALVTSGLTVGSGRTELDEASQMHTVAWPGAFQLLPSNGCA
jgi:hypothetical protein